MSSQSHIQNIMLLPDILDTVIDWIAGDRTGPLEPTLYACALVCRSWAPRSQSLIFHTIKLVDPINANRFLDVVPSSPSIRHHVRELVVGQYLPVQWPRNFSREDFCPTLSRFLPRLRRIEIRGFQKLPVLLSPSYFSFPTVESFCLMNIRSLSPEEVSAFLEQLPRLQELELLGCFWRSTSSKLPLWNTGKGTEGSQGRDGDENSGRGCQGRRRSIQKLAFPGNRYSKTMYDFLHFALQNKLLSGLASLECSPDNNISELELILKACSATLRHVTFDVAISLKYPLLFPSLVNNTVLDTLHLVASPFAPESAHLLSHWLLNGTTRSFKVISFSYFSNFHDLTPPGYEENLKELDEVLSSPAFPWLSRFQFQPRLILHKPRRSDQTQKKLRAIFPKLIERGVFWIGIYTPRGLMDPEAVHVLPTACDDYGRVPKGDVCV